MSPHTVDVAIIGAGPYGLSLATHLRARGIEHRILGRPMHAWRSMPSGMYLKSVGCATNIPTLNGHPTLPEYCLAQGLDDYAQIEISTFAGYGLSVQQQLVPYLEQASVSDVRRHNDHFVLTLDTGERFSARRVVVAIGLSYFEQVPEVLSALPRGLASHSVHHGDFAPFAGRDVAVVGAGQSALQAAALLHEANARVHVVARRRTIVWGGTGPRHRTVLERMRVPHTTIGPGWGKWVVEHVPMLLHHLPAAKRLHYTRTKLGPSGAWWLRSRVEGQMPIATNTSIVGATVASETGQVRLRLNEDGVGERDLLVDHVIAGTGFNVDVDRLPFLSVELARQIRRLQQAPLLSRHFESSVPGLYFVGPASVPCFGPLFRFVAGATYTVPAVARHLALQSRTLRVLRNPAQIVDDGLLARSA
jgi:FAD-dependent urate hydroxylase